jgi:cellulose synthase/poly-beta-1,6-N-acetylglucosamine synthase-like glycosyltransferase
MLNVISFWVFWGLIIITLFQIGFTLTFARLLKPSPVSLPTPAPKATIILCLRGADPFLPNCLHGLLHQDYPNYSVQIIVDSPEDPAWAMVNQALQQPSSIEVRVSTLKDYYQTCSLKCSAILQAIAQLDDTCEVIALIDADAIAHPTWLSELVALLSDSRVAATTGNRWYTTHSGQWGDLVRYLWNVSAVVTMYFNQIPWGGSLAIKTQSLKQAGILEKWQQAFSEDVLLYQALRDHQLKVQFVPSVLMVNRENCTLGSFIRWVARQFLIVRLYHPSWWGTVIYGLYTLLLVEVGFLAILIAALSQQWAIAGWVSLAIAFFFSISTLLTLHLERRVQAVVQARGETLARSANIAKLWMALPFSQVVCAIALMAATWIRRVTWRGTTYQISGPWKIRLVSYFPYRSSIQPNQLTASIR